jgi:hypothetical protein
MMGESISGSGALLKLNFDQAFVKSVLVHQFRMASGFNYPALLEHNNAVCTLDGSQAMGDDD